MIIGIDTNILSCALDKSYSENEKVKDLLTNLSLENIIAINPTVLHESYHTLVYYLEWVPQEAARRLSMMLRHPFIKFYNHTQKTSLIALNLAVKHGMDGRDALIAANYIAHRTPTIYTHDKELLKLQK